MNAPQTTLTPSEVNGVRGSARKMMEECVKDQVHLSFVYAALGLAHVA